MKCVAYGVKSSPDEKGAVDDQLRQVVSAIKREHGEVAGEFSEENESGYRKSRGPELAAAIKLAVGLADEGHKVELWVWHPSRLARGTGKKGEAQSLVERLTYLRRHGVTARAVERADMLANPLLWSIEAEQQTTYSQNLGTWTAAGLRRRKEAGKPVGAVPFGYAVEKAIVDGNVVSHRVINPKLGPVRVQIVERLADHQSPGTIARWLNGQGLTTARGKPFRARAVRQIAESDVHDGGSGYPPLVTPELAQAARDALRRMDPAAVQRRKGGRPPRDEAPLRGFTFCDCGAPLYRTRKYLGGRPAYLCAEKVQSNGRHDDAKPILAELLEPHVFNHLDCFMDSVEGWIGGLLTERDSERHARIDQLDQEKAALAALDRQRDERMAELESVGVTKVGLELIERIDAKRDAQGQRIAEAEAVLAEWTAPSGVDEVLDFYNGLHDAIEGRIGKAQGARELNEALASVLAGMWCRIEDGRLWVEFELRDQPQVWVCSPDDSPLPPTFLTNRDWLPPAELPPSKPDTSPRYTSRNRREPPFPRAPRA